MTTLAQTLDRAFKHHQAGNLQQAEQLYHWILQTDPRHADALHLLGLIAEKVTETVRREPADFVASGVTTDRAPYLGPVTHDGGQLIRWIDVQKLLPAAVSSVLFRQAEESAWSTPESPRC